MRNWRIDHQPRWTAATIDRRQVLGGLAAMAAGLAGVGASFAAHARADDGTPEPSGTLGERLITEARGATDEFGRIPLSRLRFDAGAVLPTGILAGPFVVIVETGEFEVEADIAQEVGPGGRLEVAPGIAVGARNTSDAPGSWLVLMLVTEADGAAAVAQFEAVIYSDLTPEDVPSGLEHLRLTRYMNLRATLVPVRFTMERVVLAPGEAIESLDLGGPTPTFGSGLIVDAGSLQETGKPDRDPLLAGEDTQFDADEDSGVQALGDEPAVLLVLHMGEVEEEE